MLATCLVTVSMLVSFQSTWNHPRHIWEERISVEELPSSDYHPWASLWRIFLISNWYGRTSPLWAVPFLGRWPWFVWESRPSKPVSSIVLWTRLHSLLPTFKVPTYLPSRQIEFLPQIPSLSTVLWCGWVKENKINTFLPEFFWEVL